MRGRITTSGSEWESGNSFATFVSESFFNHEHEYKMLTCKKLEVLVVYLFILPPLLQSRKYASLCNFNIC